MRDLADELLQAKVKAKLFGGDHAPRLGRLVILDRLGAGAMGTVYAAYDPRLDRKVAVKVMHAADPDANARFLREARALAKLVHPNIVAIHDAGDDTGAVHVVMELATGVPMRAWLGGPLTRDWREVVRVMTDIARALAAAHGANIVHRDVKPDNILVGDDRARLVDFGLAREPASSPGNATSTPAPDSASPLADTAVELDDHAAGTPSYMAPEVLAGNAATPASDQFSFGVTLYEALYGTRPYHGATRAELRDNAMRAADAIRRGSRSTSRVPADPAPPADPHATLATQPPSVEPARRTVVLGEPPAERVPAWIDAILRRALAGDPEKRFPSMDALATELLRDRRRRRRTIALVAAAVAIGGAAGALAYRAREATAPAIAETASCDGSAKLSAVWNDRAERRVRQVLEGAAWTEATLAGFRHYATQWQTSFRTVCEATRVRGEQSDRLLELRSRCLDRSLARLDALAEALSVPLGPHERIELQVAGAVGELPNSKLCETVTDDEQPLPADPAQRAEVASIERELDHGWAAYAVGRYQSARTRAITLSQRTGKLPGADGLQAAVLTFGGAVEGRVGQSRSARELLERAIVLAAQAHAPRLELAAWTRLLRHVVLGGDSEKAIDWSAFAYAAASRAGAFAEIDAIIGDALRQQNRFDEARAKLTDALERKDRGDTLREDVRSLVEMNLGSVELASGKSAVAETIYRRAFDRARRALGDGHPTLAIHMDRLAEAARARGELRTALALHEQSIELRRKAHGADDRSVATAHLHRAETLLEAGRLNDAFADAERALAIRKRQFGSSSPRLAEPIALLADIAVARDQLAEAAKLYDRAHVLAPDRPRRIRGLVAALGSLAAPAGGPLDRARFAKLLDALGLARLDVSEVMRAAANLEPFTVDHVIDTAARLSLIPPGKATPLVAALVERWRAAGKVDAALSLAVADAALADGDRASAAEAYRAALDALADEPSRARLHAQRGLSLALDGDAAKATAKAADTIASAMPELAR